MLGFDLRINGQLIGYFHAVRTAGTPEENSIGTYDVEMGGRFNGPDSEIGLWTGEVQHRYGDGAWELVRKSIEQSKER